MARSRGTRRNREALRRLNDRSRNAPTCAVCGKRSYRTQMEALEAIAGSQGQAGGRVYECGGGWHITSRKARKVS